jgi:DNA-binding transcriptional LysR family regulator
MSWIPCSGNTKHLTQNKIDSFYCIIDQINVLKRGMNVHHLELFYYVARHGGITAAVRMMPYGIQQPAVSSQITRLEESLGGVTLFSRRPFALTPAGQQLYEFIAPFFGGLDSLTARLASSHQPVLRLGSSNHVLRDHLPDLLKQLRADFPQAMVSLREVDHSAAETALRAGELDIAVVARDHTPIAGLQWTSLLELPLVLMASTRSQLPDLDAFAERHKATKTTAPDASHRRAKSANRSKKTMTKESSSLPPLIALPAREAVTTIFQRDLTSRGLGWETAIEANSLEVIEACAAAGFGVGLGIHLPGRKNVPHLERRILRSFSPLEVIALWRGRPDPLVTYFLKVVKERAKKFL